VQVSHKSSRFLPWPEVKRRVPYTRQHLSRLEKLGQFPRRVHLGGNKVAWLEHEIEGWMEARAAERDQAA
jgi:prophage regulatory protein